MNGIHWVQTVAPTESIGFFAYSSIYIDQFDVLVLKEGQYLFGGIRGGCRLGPHLVDFCQSYR